MFLLRVYLSFLLLLYVYELDTDFLESGFNPNQDVDRVKMELEPCLGAYPYDR